MLASDAQNTQFVGAHNPDQALSVRFYSKPIQQIFRSQKEDRPIFEDVDYIEIWTPGGSENVVDTPVRTEHKSRFPIQWANYQNGKASDQNIVGTIVSAWPFLTAAQAEEFKAMKFFTVEQLANASDAQLQKLGMVGGMNPMEIRNRAKLYLTAAAGTAVVQQEAALIEELRSANARMQEQINALMEKMQEPKVEAKKRGPKPRLVQTEQPADPEPIATHENTLPQETI
tara:strand:- start:114 stop:800 length:687 start_codon:yes stop_codon:yes gene_type:complete